MGVRASTCALDPAWVRGLRGRLPTGPPRRSELARCARRLREAVRWVRRHADEFLVDQNRLVAFGSGSGAHLALLLGTFPPDQEPDGISSRVQAVISMYGPADLPGLVNSRRLPNEPARQFLGVDSADWPACPPPHPWNTSAAMTRPPCWCTGRTIAGCRQSSRGECPKVCLQPVCLNALSLLKARRQGFELLVGFPPKTRDLLPEILAFLDSVWQVPLREIAEPAHIV